MKQLRLPGASRASIFSWCILIFGVVITSSASAVTALQLGPGGGAGWNYDTGTQTWVYSGAQPFTLNAYANATKEQGGNGFYAWETEPDPNRYAYLAVSAIPDLGDLGDVFTVNISNATQVASGYGTPPIEDPNSLAPHGIFDAYFEIYEFQFDGAIGLISDQQPGQTGTGNGYTEGFGISWSDDTGGNLTGLHFDLFTVVGDGRYIPGASIDKSLVYAFAPFSHDAETSPIPIPAAVWLFGTGLIGLVGIARCKKAA